MSIRLAKKDRQSRIVHELSASSHLRIADLADRFEVSTETIRRDLEDLREQGLVNRAYGGAISTRPMGIQPTYGEREQAAVDERWRIGETAADLVSPGEVLMVDAGATTAQFARSLALHGRDLTILTNSLSVAVAVTESPGIRAVLCPGDYSARESAVYGPETLDFLGRFQANKAVLGASALDAAGAMDVNTAASWVKRVMMRQAEQSLFLVDSSKFGQRRLEVIAPLSSIDALVTDADPPPDLARALDRAGAQVLVAGERRGAQQSSEAGRAAPGGVS